MLVKTGTAGSNPLTATDLMGTLSPTYLYSVFNYTCNLNYLQKVNTTISSFDCSAGPLDIITLGFHFYLWGGTYSSAGNFSSKPTDILYNAGTGGVTCGLQINQEDCTVSTPALAFGLYGQSTGIYTTPVSLPVAPNAGSALYGYAAATDTYSVTGTSYTVCPPGLINESIYTATPTASTFTSAPFPSAPTNIPTSQLDTIVAATSSPPSAMTATETSSGTATGTSSGGYCTSTVTTTVVSGTTSTGTYSFCTLPTVVSQGPVFAYGAETNTMTGTGTQVEFCVIPSTLLVQ
jgi:hypothetical protein